VIKPRLLDLFCGAGGAGMGYYRAGFDNMPYVMVEYIYGKIRRNSLCGLWQNPQGANQKWSTDKSTMSSVRSQTSCGSETRQLGKKGITSTLERWNSFRTKWLSFNSCPVNQPLPFNGRYQGEGI
jgi:hypothetical protein